MDDEELMGVDDVIYSEILDDIDAELFSTQREGDAIDIVLGIEDEDIEACGDDVDIE